MIPPCQHPSNRSCQTIRSFYNEYNPTEKEYEIQEVSWDRPLCPPCNDLFQELVEQFDHRRSSPECYSSMKETSLSPQRILPISTHGCKCSKIGCLKLYCECFTNGLICGPHCLCTSCQNCAENSEKILSAQQMANFRKPGTFIGVGAYVPERKCNCKKSKCQKKYCQCYNSGLKCSSNCECIGCQNQEVLQDEEFRMEVQALV